MIPFKVPLLIIIISSVTELLVSVAGAALARSFILSNSVLIYLSIYVCLSTRSGFADMKYTQGQLAGLVFKLGNC